MSKTSNAALKEAPATKTAEPALAEYELIAQRLADGLAQVESQEAEHQTQLSAIAESLAAIPGALAEVQSHLAALQQEQVMLPRRIQAARALVMGSMGTSAEAQAKERLETLLARQQTLPPELAEAEAAVQSTRKALAGEQVYLETERTEHLAALQELAGIAEGIREEASKAHWHIGQAELERLKDERQAKRAKVEATEATAAEARADLAAFDAAIPARMAAHQTHLGEALQLVPQPEEPALVLFHGVLALMQQMEALAYNPHLGQQPHVPAFLDQQPIGSYLTLEADLIQATLAGGPGGGVRMAERRAWLEKRLDTFLTSGWLGPRR